VKNWPPPFKWQVMGLSIARACRTRPKPKLVKKDSRPLAQPSPQHWSQPANALWLNFTLLKQVLLLSDMVGY
ncbi:hypothetical protein ACVBEH_28245, partial [Roseateles sp. GG27B]